LFILTLIDLVERYLMRTIILLDVPPPALERFTTNIRLEAAAPQIRIMNLLSQLLSKRNHFVFNFLLSFLIRFFFCLCFLSVYNSVDTCTTSEIIETSGFVNNICITVEGGRIEHLYRYPTLYEFNPPSNCRDTPISEPISGDCISRLEDDNPVLSSSFQNSLFPIDSRTPTTAPSASPSFAATSAIKIPEVPFYGWTKYYSSSRCVEETGSMSIEHILLETCLIGTSSNKKYVCGEKQLFFLSLIFFL
jgi:hypothetical protein